MKRSRPPGDFSLLWFSKPSLSPIGFHSKLNLVSSYGTLECMTCIVCVGKLTGKQSRFCSRKCRNQDSNRRNQNYECQQQRGIARKVRLVDSHGGKCQLCGYSKNYAVLSFHHIDPTTKSFGLDLRACSNHTWDTLVSESKKCQLLCANCHTELHNPVFG